jgi:hypothetical protein
LLNNGSFEQPILAPNGYAYYGTASTPSTTVPGWSFYRGALARNGSIWSAPTAPDGSQVAAVQGVSSIAQTATLQPGTYTLSVMAAQRQCCSQPYNQTLNVTLDGVALGVVNPTGGFQSFTFPVSITAAGAHTFNFAGTASGADKTVFLDAVTLQ